MKSKTGNRPSNKQEDQKINEMNTLPFYGVGKIYSPAYEHDLDEIFKQENIITPSFNAENQPFAEIKYKASAPSIISKITRYDKNYVMQKSVSSGFEEWTEFALMFASCKQLVSTFDKDIVYLMSRFFEHLQADIHLPKVWCDVVKLMGNMGGPYGPIKQKYPVQTILDFALNGIRAASTFRSGEKSYFSESFKDHTPKLAELFDTVKTGFRRDAHYVLESVPQSVSFAKEYAKQLWDDFCDDNEIIQKVEGNLTFRLRLWSADKWESLLIDKKGKDATEKKFTDFCKWIAKLSISGGLKLRLESLMSVILFGKVTTLDQLDAVPEFTFLPPEITLELVGQLVKLFYRYYCENYAPILKQIYQVEKFVAGKKGHDCQLVVVDENGKCSSKVNITGYAVALAYVFNITERIHVVRNLYTTTTQLNDESASIFVTRCSKIVRDIT